MKTFLYLIALVLVAACSIDPAQSQVYVLVIHGGAGVMEKKDFTPEQEKEYLDKLQQALDNGETILKSGNLASEVEGRRSEVRGRRSEVRGRRSEVRGQRSEVRGQ